MYPMGTAILFCMGAAGIINGFRMLRGGSKSWYFARHLYAGGIYAQIPMGIGFLFLGASTMAVFQSISSILIKIGLGMGVAGVIFSFLRPSFLKPTWYRHLEHKHKDMMPLLRKEAHRMGLDVWEERIASLEDLETWVNEVRDRNPNERDFLG
jgi:hypothetical protein